MQHIGAGQQESHGAYRWNNGWKSPQQTHCAKILTGHVSIIRTQALQDVKIVITELKRVRRLHSGNWMLHAVQVLHHDGGCHIHTITLTGNVLLLAVYYSNMRPDIICLTRGGICRMGCANAFSDHRPHCSHLLVDAISCSCKARQAPAYCCHTASAGTMMEYVWTLSHKITKRGHIAWSRGWLIAGWKEWWKRPWWW